MRHYYAVYNRHGIMYDASYNSFADWFANSFGVSTRDYTFRRFDTRAERDKWLDNQYDRYGRALAVKCTRALVEKKLGRDFIVTSDGRCFAPCW